MKKDSNDYLDYLKAMALVTVGCFLMFSLLVLQIRMDRNREPETSIQEVGYKEEDIEEDYSAYKDSLKYIVSSNYVLLEVVDSETYTVSGDRKYIKLTLKTKEEPGYSTLPDETFTRVYPLDYYKKNISKSETSQVDLIPTVVERCFLVSGKLNDNDRFSGGVVTSFQAMDKALNLDDIEALADTMYSYDYNMINYRYTAVDVMLDSVESPAVPTFNESYYRDLVSNSEQLPNVTLYDNDNRQLASLKGLTQSKFRREMNAEIEKAEKYFKGGLSDRSYTDYSGEFEVYKGMQKRKAVAEVRVNKANR